MFSGFSRWFSGGGGGKTQCLTLFRGWPQERSTEPEIMLDIVMPMSRQWDSRLVDGSHSHMSINFSQNGGKGCWGSKEPQSRSRGLIQRPVDEKKQKRWESAAILWNLRKRQKETSGIRMQTMNAVLQASWHMVRCWMELPGGTVLMKAYIRSGEAGKWWGRKGQFCGQLGESFPG